MFARIKAWLSKEREATIELNEDDLDFLYTSKSYNGSSGSYFARNPDDIGKGCDVEGCERPSAVTALSHAKVKVDLGGYNRDRYGIKENSKLPIFSQYRICDRHWRDDIDGVRSKAGYVEASSNVIVPEDEKKSKTGK